ncbi:Protein CBG11412 [Caenorhabditis briggsae]|uniref:Decapping nuclease n=1 Tax=Caenorhabditis briggsae TaxID=6238 RepID=A8XD32_CAEBR|nr:Protein CBG11412 [Caenorhabditis briggsae]CAP30550.2 Protein CBG11412 [Caenorhabditis briggsae]
MSVKIDVKRVGTFTKLADKLVSNTDSNEKYQCFRTAVPGGQAPRLNEDPSLYGRLQEEMDLTLGCENYKDDGHGDRYCSFFDYIKKTTEKGSSMKEAIGADFVSNRRNLIVIAQSAYKIEPMEIQAFRQNGVIFLCDKAEDLSVLIKKMGFSSFNFREEEVSWPQGHKFERYLTLNEEGKPHDKYEELHTEERFKLVLRTTLKTTAKPPIKVFYAAEIDAVDSKGEYVEIKTTGLRHDMWLERNSLKNYLQSALANISYIIYGKKARGRWNHIYRVDKVFTETIPSDRVNWKKDVCFEQLFNVLDKIKSKLEYDDEALVLKKTEEGLFFEPECSKNCIFMDSDFLEHFA